mgnify:CR=1 FL=1
MTTSTQIRKKINLGVPVGELSRLAVTEGFGGDLNNIAPSKPTTFPKATNFTKGEQPMSSKVFPTKNNLIATKKSLDLAKLGYDLMDRKRNILIREIMTMTSRAATIQSEINAAYAKAYYALEQAQISIGNCSSFAESIPVDNGLNMTVRSVMGVELPQLSLERRNRYFYYGLNASDSLLDEAYINFEEVKYLTVQLAEIESNVMRLADAIKKTQKRTNALSNVMIPKFTSTVKFISDALDEKEREDFSRLKVIKRQKGN